jgi:pilus assembly protein CpaE
MTAITLLAADRAVERLVRAAIDSDGSGVSLATIRPRENVSVEVEARELAAHDPDLVLIGPPVDVDRALAIATVLDRSHPEIVVVLIQESDPSLWERALRAGVRDVVSPTADAAAFADIIQHARVVAETRRSNIIELSDGSGPTRHGRIVTVLSPKGGAGKTTIATNLAVGLARLAPDGVAIVDLDLQFGDVASALQLLPERSLADLAPGEFEDDPARIKLLLTHHAESLFALCAPDDPAAADGVSPDDVGPILRSLAAELSFVVVDTCAGIDAHTLAAIEVSTDLVFVGAMDVPSIRSLRKLIDALDRLGMTHAQRLVVLNRADSHVDLAANDVADALGLPIAVSIPSSRSVPLSINHGSPVLVFDPRSPVVRPLRDLVAKISGEPVSAVTASHTLFRRIAR